MRVVTKKLITHWSNLKEMSGVGIQSHMITLTDIPANKTVLTFEMHQFDKNKFQKSQCFPHS